MPTAKPTATMAMQMGTSTCQPPSLGEGISTAMPTRPASASTGAMRIASLARPPVALELMSEPKCPARRHDGGQVAGGKWRPRMQHLENSGEKSPWT